MLGESFSHFRILQKLGAGGMGEVYVAEDLRLGRRVAIKLLPPSLVAQAAARERFQREARAIAALNHPHICVLHEVGEAERTGEPPQPFLVMELLEGQTLREKIHGQPQPLPQILHWGIQLADGLAAAHQAGLIHRDLKPANIIITRRGDAKILDFGLARITRPSLPGFDSQAETVTVMPDQLTSPGMTLGTVAYMSPEQARGETADARSDLFSLGVIFHEMATGQQLFNGKSAAETFKQILADPALSLRQSRPDLPPELDAIVAKMLEKDPELRCQTAAEVRADLKRLERASAGRMTAAIAAEAGAGAAAVRAPAPASRAEPVSAAPRAIPAAPASDSQIVSALLRRHRRGLFIGALLLLLAGSGDWIWRQYLAGAQALLRAWQHPRAEQFTSSGNITYAAISRNGQYVAYIRQTAQGESLWLHQIATPGGVQVVAPGIYRGYRGLIFTPDSNYLYFLAGNLVRPSLYQIPVLGGQARLMLDNIQSLPAFSPGGHRFAFIRFDVTKNIDQLRIASSDMAVSHKLADAPPTMQWTNSSLSFGVTYTPQTKVLAWSRDGRRIYGILTKNGTNTRLAAVNVATGQKRLFGPNAIYMDLEALPGTRELWTVASGNFSMLYSPQIELIGYPSGQSATITSGLGAFSGLSLTANGQTLATVEKRASSAIWIWPRQQSAPQPWIASSSNLPGMDSLAWGAQHDLLFTRHQPGYENIWRAQWGSDTPAAQITQNQISPSYLVVSPNGRHFLFGGYSDATLHLAQLAGGPSHLLKSNAIAGFYGAGGQTIYYVKQNNNYQTLYRMPRQGGSGRQVAQQFIGMMYQPRLSPKGQRLLIETHDPQTGKAVSAIFYLHQPRQISYFPLHQLPEWMPDGQAISYVRTVHGIQNIWLQTLRNNLPFGQPRQLTHFRDRQIAGYAWAPDGTLAIARLQQSSDVVLFHAR